MIRISIYLFCQALSVCTLFAQSPFNVTISNLPAKQILKGDYDPSDFQPGFPTGTAGDVICVLRSSLSADSLKNYLTKLEEFQTRNTYSDTISLERGIGAARRWVFQQFYRFGQENENRLIPSYMLFEMDSDAICGKGLFSNVFAVLPGMDTSDPSIILIEAHMDSRCEVLCDTACFAPGVDDNGSGTALVIELARVLSQFSYDHSIVFMATVGEEHGLWGAEAFASYSQDQGIKIKAVQNNDIVGGIICGETSSSPSCPGEAHIDSTQLRIFSQGVINSPHKDFARFVKTVYQEKLEPVTTVPMMISIIPQEDRSGRGGDHIPFRELGFTAIRFTSANEHGNADVSDPSYADRQHTSGDILGLDLNEDEIVDSFFVDFNYLKRNALINGLSVILAAMGPETPGFTLTDDGFTAKIEIDDPYEYNHYRIGVRTTAMDFDALYTIRETTTFDIPGLISGDFYKVCVAAVDENGIMSLYSREENFVSLTTSLSISADTVEFIGLNCGATGIEDDISIPNSSAFTLWQNSPNPFKKHTNITVESTLSVHTSALIRIVDTKGKQVWQQQTELLPGRNIIPINPDLKGGLYSYSLHVKGKPYGSKKMVILE